MFVLQRCQSEIPLLFQAAGQILDLWKLLPEHHTDNVSLRTQWLNPLCFLKGPKQARAWPRTIFGNSDCWTAQVGPTLPILEDVGGWQTNMLHLSLLQNTQTPERRPKTNVSRHVLCELRYQNSYWSHAHRNSWFTHYEWWFSTVNFYQSKVFNIPDLRSSGPVLPGEPSKLFKAPWPWNDKKLAQGISSVKIHLQSICK